MLIKPPKLFYFCIIFGQKMVKMLLQEKTRLGHGAMLPILSGPCMAMAAGEAQNWRALLLCAAYWAMTGQALENGCG